MRIIRKILPILLSLALLLSLSITAYAADTTTLIINGTTAGETYQLYKVMDLTQSGEHFAYAVNSDFAGFFDEKAWADPVGEIEGMTSSELADLSRELLDWAVSNHVAIAYSISASGATATISAVEYGYYLMNPVGASGGSAGNASMFSLGTASNEGSTIAVKATYPTIDLTVNGVSGSAAVCVEDTITYAVAAKVPDMTGYTSYTFELTSTLDETLTYTGVSSVTVGGTAADYDVKTSTSGGKTEVTITVNNFVSYAASAGSDVIIIYTATLGANAEPNAANTVTAQLKYSNDPANTSSTDKTATVQADVYTTALYIKKTDGAGNVLTGASFKLEGDFTLSYGVTYTYTENEDGLGTYWALKDGTYTSVNPETQVNGVPISTENYVSTVINYDRAETISQIPAGTSCAVDSSGELSFMGIGAGSYIITETVTPAGYHSIAPITVDITFDDGAFTVTADGTTVSGNTLTIVNQSGVQLPATGGSGTAMLYLLGGLMVLAGLMLQMAKKRA